MEHHPEAPRAPLLIVFSELLPHAFHSVQLAEIATSDRKELNMPATQHQWLNYICSNESSFLYSSGLTLSFLLLIWALGPIL